MTWGETTLFVKIKRPLVTLWFLINIYWKLFFCLKPIQKRECFV
jgi:hypothetical protein